MFDVQLGLKLPWVTFYMLKLLEMTLNSHNPRSTHTQPGEEKLPDKVKSLFVIIKSILEVLSFVWVVVATRPAPRDVRNT